LLDEGVVEDSALMKSPGRVTTDRVVDLGSDRDLDLAIGGIDLLDLQGANRRSVVVDRRSDLAVVRSSTSPSVRTVK
jgi:hypothetical protein